MKKFNILLLAVFVIITGIIFASCNLSLSSPFGPGTELGDICPYCKSKSVKEIDNDWPGSKKVIKCNNCGKTFTLYPG